MSYVSVTFLKYSFIILLYFLTAKHIKYDVITSSISEREEGSDLHYSVEIQYG